MNSNEYHILKEMVRRELESTLPIEVVKSIRWTKGWDGQTESPVCQLCMFHYIPIPVYLEDGHVLVGPGRLPLTRDAVTGQMVYQKGMNVRKIKESPYRLPGLRRGRARPITKRPIREGE